MRWRLRCLFLGLMAIGVCWIYLLNCVRLGKTPDQYSPGVHVEAHTSMPALNPWSATAKSKGLLKT